MDRWIDRQMADHAGGPRSMVNPGTKLWRPPVEVTQFWRPRRSFGASFRFCKTKQNKFISMKPNINSNHFQQLLFHTIPPPLDQYNLFWSYIKRAPKLSYFNGRASQLTARVDHGTPSNGVIGHRDK